MPKATLLTRERMWLSDGSFLDMRVWHVPARVPPSPHDYKYSLAYIVRGKRVVGYDNERGKGDHRHHGGTETPYSFNSIERLLADFLADVEEERSGANAREQESQGSGR
jgi:hypothetical protein